jgi:cell division protein FtsI (penicillin-binding protein 3)
MFGSNVAAGRVAEMTGLRKQQQLLSNLNQLVPLSTGLGKTSKPIFPDNWRRDNMVVIGFGHGIANTPLHAAAAVSTLVNGGKLVEPTYVRIDQSKYYQRVIRIETSDDIKFMLRRNVEQGPARVADLANYSVGAMTSTTEKIIGGHYAEGRLMTSFIGVVPASSPKYIIMTMLDEPQPVPSDSNNTAAHNAGVIGADMINSSMQILNVATRNEDAGHSQH